MLALHIVLKPCATHGFIVHGLGGPCATDGFIVHGLGGPCTCTWY